LSDKGNASFFTHKDALRQEIPLSAPPTPETVNKVRKVIASNSESADECAQFLDMLGLLPKQVNV
jgi:hypothetical protein